MIIKNMSQIQFHTPDKNMNLPIHLSCRVFNGDVIKEILNNLIECWQQRILLNSKYLTIS